MKTWKTEIIEAIKTETEHSRIVSLKEIAADRGVNHISRQDTQDIMNAVLKAVPDYRAVRMEKTKNDSLFQSLCFVDEEIEFDSGDKMDEDGEWMEAPRSGDILEIVAEPFPGEETGDDNED